MNNKQHFNDPWLVAAWPGMGAVALSAGYYLMAKLGMHLMAEFPAREFFDLERVEVKDGLIQTGRLPRSRLFMWHDPKKRHDLIVFIGEAQPAVKGGAFCSQLINHARELGVNRVFTFAALGTQMRPEQSSRVFGAAVDPASLSDFKHLGVQELDDAYISGLNGVLLGIAAERGLSGGCLLGEIPSVFSQFPFPKASLAVLKSFTSLAGIHLDFKELQSQAKEVEQGLSEFLHHLENPLNAPNAPAAAAENQHPKPEKGTTHRITKREADHVEELFEMAVKNRGEAYALKQELDRLKVFADYEDRFLDLFKEPG